MTEELPAPTGYFRGNDWGYSGKRVYSGNIESEILQYVQNTDGTMNNFTERDRLTQYHLIPHGVYKSNGEVHPLSCEVIFVIKY